jgi:TrkA family protein
MPLFALLIIVAIALLIVRIGATALMMTGLSRDVAEFQAISCFFGVGFTTNEAEMIVGHPTRRRIAQHLIISGNIGLTGALGTVIMTLTKDEPEWINDRIPDALENSFFLKLGLILIAILIIGGIFRLKIVKRILERLIQASLKKFHNVRAIDYETVLRSSDGYAVIQFEIECGHPMIGRTLAGVMLGSKGVLVLGIKRAIGEYIGAPHATTEILEKDVLTVYGQEDAILKALDPESTTDRAG